MNSARRLVILSMQGCEQSEAPFPGPGGAPGQTEAAGEALVHRTSSLASASLMPSITPALERQLQVPLTLLYLYSCLHLCLQRFFLCLLYLCLAHSLGSTCGGPTALELASWHSRM